MPPDRFVPHDPALPALDLLFEGEAPSRFIANALSVLSPTTLNPEELSASYVRYRPGKSCVVGWSNEGGNVLLSGRVFHDDRAAKLLAKETSREAIDRTAGTDGAAPYRYMDEQRLLLQRFPIDLQLQRLSLATDSDWLGRQFDVDATSISYTAVSYKPWRRCVLRYDVDSNGTSASYFAKLFRDDRGTRLLRWHEIVTTALKLHGAPWSIPNPRDYIPAAQMLLFDAVDDALKVRRLLRQGLKHDHDRAQLLSYVAAAANGLPSLQQARIADLPSRTPQQLLQDFRRRSEGISAVAPEFAAQLARAFEELDAVANQLPAEPMVTTHGAFRHDQLLHADGRLIVLDLDTLCLSGASADAGNFLGFLDLTAIRRPRLRPVIQACIETFASTVHANGHTTREWRMWYRAAAHIKKAIRAFFALEPDWPETSTELITLAIRTLRDVSPTRVPLRDAALSFVDTATNRRQVRGIITERVLPELYPGHTLRGLEIEYSRYKAAREHVTLYRLRLKPDEPSEPVLVTATFGKKSRLEKAHERAAAIGSRAGASLLLQDQGCLFQVFPCDSGLPLLQQAADSSHASELLTSMLSEQVTVRTVGVLRYRPGRRCVLQYEAERDAGPLAMVGKLYRRERRAIDAARTHAALAPQSTPALALPRVLAEPYGGILLMEYIDGRSFGDTLEHELSAAKLEHAARSAAQALAVLHTRKLETHRRRTLESELVSLQERLALLRQAAPELAAVVEASATKIAERMTRFARPDLCTIHGEYKPNQLLVSNAGLALVDLDRVCTGDPAIDVGNFAAVLRKEVVLEGHAHLSGLSHLFVSEYLEQRPMQGLSERARLYEAIALLRMLVRNFERSPQRALQLREEWHPLILDREVRVLLESL